MSGFADYIEDIITQHIASVEGGSPDFIIAQPGSEDEFVYVDPEAGKLFLITVREAKVEVAS